MYTQILNFIIQPLLGGAAGYITNEYAINMLFKSYTPLKIGGVIPKTRDEFIANITRLIEEDIINKDKLEEILCDTKLINNFHKLSDDFYSKFLYTAVGNKTLEQIPGFEELSYQIKKLITDNAPELIRLLSDYVLNTPEFNTSVAGKILPEAVNNAFDELNRQGYVSNIYTTILDSLADSCNTNNTAINHIISNDAVDKIIDSIIKNTLDIINEDEKVKSSIDRFINTAIEQTGLVDSIIEYLRKLINNNSQSIVSFMEDIKKDLLASDNFKEFLKNTTRLMLDFGEGLEIPLIELIEDKSLGGIKKTISALLPHAVELLSQLIATDENVLKELIHQSVDEAIDEQDSSKKLMLSMAKGTVHSKIDAFDIKQTLNELTSSKEKTENLSLKAAVYIKKYLTDTTIAQIIRKLKSNCILTEENFSKFMYLKLDELDLSSLLKAININELLSNTSEGSFIQNKIYDFIQGKIISSNNSNMCDIIISNIKSAMYNKAHTLMANNIADVCNYAKSIKPGNDSIEILKSFSIDALNKLDISKILAENTENTTDYIASYCNDFTVKYQGTSLHELLDRLNNINELHTGTAEAVRYFLLDNLAPALNKFIHGLSSANLEKLSDEELCEMAKSFIGNNLKPIMYFGGLLGIIAGLLLATFNGNASILSPTSLSQALTYAGVGFLTNAIAINMLFKPYKEIKFLKNVPFFRHFSLGYIAKNKAQMADGFAYALDKYLLSDASINELFDKYEDIIRSGMICTLEDQCSEKVYEYLQRNKNNINKYISDKINSELYDNKNQVSSYISDKLSDIALTDIFIDNSQAIGEKISASKETLNVAIVSRINKLVKSNTNITDISFFNIPANLDKTIDKYIDELVKKYSEDNSNHSLDSSIDDFCKDISEKITCYIADYIEKSKGLKFNDLVNTISEFINRSLVNIYNNPQIKQFLIKDINKELAKDKEIADILNGKVSEFFNKYITQFTGDIQTKSLDILVKLKPYASDYIQEQIVKGLNFLTKGLYNMAGGSQIVDTATEIFMTKKLPIYFANRSNEINRLLTGISSDILNTKINSFGLAVNSSVKLAQTSANTAVMSELIMQVSDFSVNTISNRFSTLSLEDILNMFNYTDTATFRQSLFCSTEQLVDKSISRIIENINTLADEAKLTAKDISKAFCDKVQINDIFANISLKDIDQISSYAVGLITDQDFLINCFSNINDMFKQSDCKLMVKDICDINELYNSFNKIVDHAVCDENFNSLCASQISILIDKISQDSFGIINPDTKAYFFGCITDASILSLRANATKILNDIGFDTLIREQLLGMSNKKIHKMFNSFAGKYFRTLMIYGVFGAIFGINTIAGIAIASAYGIKKLVNKK